MDHGAESYRRYLAGDDMGFVEIIQDHQEGLILYLNGLVGNIFTAEELMEETFFKLVSKKPRFSGKSTFKTWLYAIGRHIAIDYLRHQARRGELPLTDSAPALLREQASVEQAYLVEEHKIMVHKALGQLKSDYRQVLYLSYFEGFSNEEIAAVMRRSKHSVENLMYRARKALGTVLKKEGITHEGFF